MRLAAFELRTLSFNRIPTDLALTKTKYMTLVHFTLTENTQVRSYGVARLRDPVDKKAARRLADEIVAVLVGSDNTPVPPGTRLGNAVQGAPCNVGGVPYGIWRAVVE